MSRENVLWIGTQDGIAAYKQGAFKVYTKDSNTNIVGDIVYHISAARDSSIWFGMRGGAVKYEDGTWSSLTKSNTSLGVTSKRVYTILVNKKSEIWIGTREGLSKLSYIKK